MEFTILTPGETIAGQLVTHFDGSALKRRHSAFLIFFSKKSRLSLNFPV